MKTPRLVQVVALSVVLVVCFAATASAVVNHLISSITPDNGANTGSVSVTIDGSGFEPGETVWLYKPGWPNINGTSVVVVDPSQITCDLDLTGAQTGGWDVKASNSTYGETQLAFGFMVTDHAVDSITPDSGDEGVTVSVTIAGSSFLAGETVALKKTGESNINGTSVVVNSSTELTCSFSLPSNSNGVWDVTATNATYGTATLTGGFTILKHAPTAVIDSITPAPALGGASVTFTGHGTDPWGGHTITSHWWRSDLDGTLSTSASFSTTTLSRGSHTIDYRVTCSGGAPSNFAVWGGNPLVIQNNPPTVTSVAITPDPAYTDDDLTATPSGWADADGDPEGYDWQWEKDTGGGFAVIAGQTTDTLGSANFVKDDVIRVTATPNDGFDTGAPVTDTITISNSAPTVASVALTPDPAGTNDDITATPSGWFDADGDPEGYSYGWTVSGAMGVGGTSATITSDNYVKGDLVEVSCRPDDGTEQGPVVNDDITIGNSVPTAPTVVIAPANPTTNDSFRATASGSTDADGDPVTYAYQWYKNGVLQVGVTWRTISSSRTRGGQVWRCVVTPNDGAADGPTGEDQVTVATTISQPTVTITPDDPTNKEHLVANASGSVDSDGDPVTYVYRWFRDGVAQPDLAGMRIIRSWRTLPGQVWRCVVTPTDGANNGPTGEATVTINTRPGPPTVVIVPQGAKPIVNPTTNDNLPTRIVACDDPDGDPITYTYQWYKDGVAQPGVIWRSIGAWRTRAGQEWTVVVTPSDLHGEGKPGETTVIIQPAKSGPLAVSALAAIPTAAGAEVSFALSADASVTCEVLNIAGRAVKTIVADRPMAEGINSLAWDGRNMGGLQVPAGMYLVRMTATTTGGARWTSMGTLSLTR